MDEIPQIPTQLRAIQVSPSIKLKVSGIDGVHVSIKAKSPTKTQKAALFKAFDFIDQRLTVEEYRQEVRVAMNVAGFLITGNRKVGAYTCKEIIILNKGLFDRPRVTFEEFCVTVLHELLHIFDEADAPDKVSDSEYEAKHDLATYGLLGVGVPMTHWAFAKYPSILQEIRVAETKEKAERGQ